MVPCVPRHSDNKLPAKLTVMLDPELTARVRHYHIEQGIGGTVGEAARELIMAALDYPEVESSLIRSARQAGYAAVKRDFMDLASVALVQFQGEWQRRMREVGREGSGVGDDTDFGKTGG